MSLAIPAVTAMTVVPVAAFGGQWTVVLTFAIMGAFFGSVSVGAHRLLSKRDAGMATSSRLALVAGVWLLVAAAASIITFVAVSVAPASGGGPELFDAWSAAFESVSGLSTTGLTMLSDPSTAQPWLQWWRSVLQWVGAIGVIVFAVTFAEPSGDHDTLVSAEWGQHPGSHAAETARRLVAVLATITAVSTAALIVVGEPVWRSINHGMTAAATGGFVITSQSVASSSGAARLILAVALVASAVSFGTIWDRVTRHGVPLWKRTQIRYGLAATLICMFGAIVTSYGVALQDLAFNSISASTTGGFSAGTSYRTVEALAVIAMLSMFIGGAAGSTAGGIKAARLAWLAKAAGRWLPGRSDTQGDSEPYLWDDDEVDGDEARHRMMGAASIAFTWLVVVVIGTVVIAVHNPSLPAGDLLFETFSATSGAGLSSGISNVDSDTATKATLIALMLAGRVEMTAFIVLVFAPVLHARRARTGA